MQAPQNLADLIADAGIRLKRWTPGVTQHVLCPRCGGGRTKEPSLAVTIDADAGGAVFVCHRGSCGWKDGARLSSDQPPVQHDRRTVEKPKAAPPAAQTTPDWLFEFFAERHIGARTVRDFGVYATARWFGEDLGELPAIVFPYFFGGDLANRKYRPHPQKQPQQQDKNALQTLFNVDRLGDAPAEIVFVEGEPDVMALYECGIHHAVTLKDGAPSKAGTGNDKRFEALNTHADMLAKAPRIVLGGDMDAPGLILREELARRLGRHRCWLVTWPTGCKDACDVLRAHGPDAVLAALDAAEPYPIAGVQRIKPGTLLALRRTPAPTTMSTGTMATDGILKLPTEGRLCVVLGVPGGGKTTWTRFVMVHTASNHNRRWAVFSPEMQPWEQFAAECAEVFIGKPFWPKGGLAGMSEVEVADAERWLSDRVTMLVCDAEDEAPTLDWILERARMTVLRDGVTDLLIDPFNEIDQQRKPGESETDCIGRMLQRIKAFGLRYGVNAWVIVHPSKPTGLKTGEKRPAPGPYDGAGSAHWANKTDLGVTIHSPEMGKAEVHVWKTRFRRWGRRGSIALLDFDEITGCYSSPVAEMTDAPARSWMDSQ